jgi:hypothetical protein
VQASVGPAQAQRALSSAAINDAARRGTGGAGHELPHMRAIQRSFGPAHDLSRVKAHVGGSAAAASAEIGAVAYTYGDHVAFGAAPSLRVAAHEAAHVIQQRQGVQLFGGVGQVGDRYERHADEVAELVVQGRSAASLLGAQADGSAASPGVQGSPAVQRLAAGEQPLDDGYSQLTNDPNWLTKAEAYEKRLGVYAYSHGKSTAVMTTALNKMKAVIDTEYDAAHKSEDQIQSLYREVFTKDDSGSAGQVGATLVLAEIRDLLANGNLRERMTAFYNAAYYNSDPSKPPLRGLKQIASDILLLAEDSMDELNSWSNLLGSLVSPFGGDLKSWSELVQDRKDKAQRLGLDDVDLGKKTEFLHGSWMRSGIKALTAYTSVGYNFSDDPFALGNLTLERELGGTTEMAISQSGRVKRSNLERDPEMRTAQDYEDLGIGLSDREKAYTKGKMGVDDLAYPTTKLPWLEGHTYYKMSDSNLWVQQIRDGLKMPVVAGVSGTTTRMLTAFKWLNTGADPLDFRLAIMGWMLPAWDHSLYEIMRGSHLAGVRGPGEGNLDDVIHMYSHVPPLTGAELRANVAVNKMFPHEEVYMSKMEADKSKSTGFKSVFGDSNYGSDLTISNNPKISEAHAVAIHGYTSGIHVLMNAVLSTLSYDVTETAGPVIVTRKMKEIARGVCRKLYLQERADNGIITPLEQTELDGLDWVESIDVFEKQNKLTDWATYCTAGGRTSQEVDTYITTTVNPWLVSIAGDVYDELKTHITMAVEGLSLLPAVNGVTVYRGDWSAVIGSRYEVGKTIELPEFNSFSTNENTAFQFAKGGNFSNPVLLELQLTGKGGRDIAAFSKYGGEDEVLMMPGSRLRIDRVKWENRGGKDVKIAEAVEV